MNVELQNLFSLEVEGISKTVNDYAVENFIRSYSKQLQTLELPKDEKRIAILVERLLEWYENNIDKIDSSRFVMNKEEHHKSMHLLGEIQRMLNGENKD